MRRETRVHRLTGFGLKLPGHFRSVSFISRTFILGTVTMLVSGAAHALAQPAKDASEPAAELVDAILIGRADITQIPSGFVDEMGYLPESGNGTLRHPSGSCSTPVVVGPDRFTEACRVHDLGYDVLRYSEKEGKRLSARARLILDWRLYEDLLQMCGTLTCLATATAYYTAVTANSIRQGYKAPREEPTTPWMALAVAVVVLSAIGGLGRDKARSRWLSACRIPYRLFR